MLGGRQVLGDDSRLVGWWLSRAGLGQSEPHSPPAAVPLLIVDRRAYLALARAPHFNAQAHCLIAVDRLRHFIFYFLTGKFRHSSLGPLTSHLATFVLFSPYKIRT